MWVCLFVVRSHGVTGTVKMAARTTVLICFSFCLSPQNRLLLHFLYVFLCILSYTLPHFTFLIPHIPPLWEFVPSTNLLLARQRIRSIHLHIYYIFQFKKKKKTMENHTCKIIWVIIWVLKITHLVSISSLWGQFICGYCSFFLFSSIYFLHCLK